MVESYSYNEIKYLNDEICLYGKLLDLIFIENNSNRKSINEYFANNKGKEYVKLSVSEIKEFFNKSNCGTLRFWSADIEIEELNELIKKSYYKKINDKKFHKLIKNHDYVSALYYAYTFSDLEKMGDCINIINFEINTKPPEEDDYYQMPTPKVRKLVK